ncbi:MAG: hypothetical protein HZA14_10550 [Nitrospirae bacterium]|nr:hypothetical protein [Nitrospirota bacterium]
MIFVFSQVHNFLTSQLLIFFLVSAVYASDTKPRVAILLFVPQNIEATSLMETIPTVLTSAFNRMNYFEIVERRTVDKEILLKGYQISSLKKEEMAKIGGALGLDFIIYGDVKKGTGTITASVNVLDIKAQTPCFQNTLTVSEGMLNDKLSGMCAVISARTLECFNRAAPVKKEKEYAELPYDLYAVEADKKINLSWKYNNAQDINGYKIYRATERNEVYLMIGAVSELVFTDQNPPAVRSVFYKVAAVYINGLEGKPSVPVEVRLAGGQMPPIFLNIVPDVKAAHLKWRPHPKSDASGFKVYRKAAAEYEFKEIASMSGDVSTYTDKGLNDNTLYNYALASVDPTGTAGGLSAILKAVTLKAPDGLKAEGGKIRRISLGWNTLASDNVKGYRIYRSFDRESGYNRIAELDEEKANSYLDKKDLGDQTVYRYRITAYNGEGMETDMSEAASAVTRGKPPVPQGLFAKDREPRKAALKWDAVKSPDDEVRGYIIFRATEENGEYKKLSEIENPDNVSFDDKEPPLHDNTTYYYKIISYNSAGVNSEMSLPASSTTKALPGVPAGLYAKSGEVKQVTLAWEPDQEKDIKGYTLYRGTSDNKLLEKIAFVKGEAAYTDGGLKDGTEYTYSAEAVDEDNLSSGLSSPVSAMTKPLPMKPLGLRTTDDNGRKALHWDANPEKDIKQYNVYKKGFLGISVKLAEVQNNSWIIDEFKGKLELFVTAVDETGLESEGSDAIVIEGRN